MPQRHRTFARGEIFPSYIVNTVLAGLSTLDHNFRVVKVNDTTIEVPAGTDDAMAAVSVDGNLRWRETPVQAAHPGGVAGTYDIFVTASANDIDAIPAPNTDNTDYAFGLAIVASGGSPVGVDHHRKVGSLVWDGAKITAVVPEVGRSVRAPAIHALYADRPPASALLNGVRFFASDKLMEWECVAGAWVLRFAYAPEVAALPGSPIDGQECKLRVVQPNGGPDVFWHLRYRATDGNWYYVGGAPLYDLDNGLSGRSIQTFGLLADALETRITTPVAGVYDVEFGASMAYAQANVLMEVAPSWGGVADGSSAARWHNPSNANSASTPLTTISRQVQLTLPATDVRLEYRPTGGNGTGNALHRWIRATPSHLTP